MRAGGPAVQPGSYLDQPMAQPVEEVVHVLCRSAPVTLPVSEQLPDLGIALCTCTVLGQVAVA